MLQAVMLGSAPEQGRREWYPKFYLHNRRLDFRMNRGEQETLFRQSRQLTRIVPSHEDLVLSVLKSPINQQSQYGHHHYSHSQEHHHNCQAHPNHKKCNHQGMNAHSIFIISLIQNFAQKFFPNAIRKNLSIRTFS